MPVPVPETWVDSKPPPLAELTCLSLLPRLNLSQPAWQIVFVGALSLIRNTKRELYDEKMEDALEMLDLDGAKTMTPRRSATG